MKTFTASLLGMILVNAASSLVFAAGNGKVTLPAANYLKDTTGNAVGYFKSDVLRT
ncbi:hypothetical protein VCSRO82_3224 [Vibrio cholerae]|uniref:hypothetical protein n=1 Tax=Vibrio cholerae TaxID=666 RepID=UPI00208B9BFC|nr:hypothetical protein [Vibrio cholerae]GHZ90852.1 hypothetical protein VCSRO82_3224 [Vibrio cholerae]